MQRTHVSWNKIHFVQLILGQLYSFSSPHMSLDMTIELRTRSFHAILVCFAPKKISWAHVLMALAKRFSISAVSLAVSVNIVPKYVACRYHGTKELSWNLIDDVFLLQIRSTHLLQ